MIDAEALTRDLLDWHRAAGRRLDAREAATPWEILVVEVMSQQTRIDRVGAYWRSFVARWPTPAALAEASTGDLLRAWAGLGYNRRAIALREAARAIVRDHAGTVPGDVAALRALPGIGPYTARAVAAAAFGAAVAPVDVNVRRVIERLAGFDAPGAVQAEADRLISREQPARWVAALMDLAATVCRRRRPICDSCPVARRCVSAGTPGEGARTRREEPFEATNRWLRGRLLALVRDRADEWVAFDGPVGAHPVERVEAALAALEAEGFIERDGRRARLA